MPPPAVGSLGQIGSMAMAPPGAGSWAGDMAFALFAFAAPSPLANCVCGRPLLAPPKAKIKKGSAVNCEPRSVAPSNRRRLVCDGPSPGSGQEACVELVAGNSSVKRLRLARLLALRCCPATHTPSRPARLHAWPPIPSQSGLAAQIRSSEAAVYSFVCHLLLRRPPIHPTVARPLPLPPPLRYTTTTTAAHAVPCALRLARDSTTSPFALAPNRTLHAGERRKPARDLVPSHAHLRTVSRPPWS